MIGYINELLVVVIVSRIVTMLAPDGETSRRYLKTVCALVTLSALISPIVHIIENFGEISSAAAGFLIPEADEAEEERSDLGRWAAAIFACAENRFGIDTSGGEVVFYTDENGVVDETAVFLMDGTVEQCEKLGQLLSGELGCDVHVYTGEVNDGTG